MAGSRWAPIVLLCAAACSSPSKTCEPECGGGEVCVDSACRRLCNDDAACEVADFCKEGGCVPTECGNGVDEGAEQCDAGLANSDSTGCTSDCMLARCGDEHVYVGFEECDDGNSNDFDTCTTACLDNTCATPMATRPCGATDVGACAFGVETCSGGVWTGCTGTIGPMPEICNGEDDDCNGTVDDVAGPSCNMPACAVAEHRCQGAELEVCNATRDGWDPVQTCGSALLCDASGARCATCAAGEHRCVGADLEVCNAMRTGFGAVQTCGSVPLCDGLGGQCTTPICSAGQHQCNGAELEICNATFDGWDPVTTCATPGLCNVMGQTCDTPVCPAGAHRCMGTTLEGCNADRTAWATDDTCAADYLCDDIAGVCIPPCTGIGFDPSTVTGLLIWLNADSIMGLMDGDGVSSWTDDENAIVFAADSGRAPTYETNEQCGRPVVRFDGSDDHFRNSGDYFNAAGDYPKTIFAVLRSNSATDEALIIGVGSHSAPANTYASGLYLFDGEYCAGANSAGPDVHLCTTAIDADQWRVVTVQVATGATEIWLDGTSTAMAGGTLGPFAYPETNVGGSCGQQCGISSRDTLDGDIGEILVYDGVLSGTDRNAIEDYLAARWL